jgi:hypothetical protein
MTPRWVGAGARPGAALASPVPMPTAPAATPPTIARPAMICVDFKSIGFLRCGRQGGSPAGDPEVIRRVGYFAGSVASDRSNMVQGRVERSLDLVSNWHRFELCVRCRLAENTSCAGLFTRPVRQRHRGQEALSSLRKGLPPWRGGLDEVVVVGDDEGADVDDPLVEGSKDAFAVHPMKGPARRISPAHRGPVPTPAPGPSAERREGPGGLDAVTADYARSRSSATVVTCLIGPVNHFFTETCQ